MDVLLEGCKVSALADSSSQVNTMMPEFIQNEVIQSYHSMDW